MKQNLGKLICLTSRQLFKLFWHLSRSNNMFFRSFKRFPPSAFTQACKTFGYLSADSMIFLYATSVLPNFLASSGNCILMSSEAKILSRYAHFLCTIIHWSMTSLMMFKSLSHCATRALIDLTYFDAARDCRIKMLSSRSYRISSGCFKP